MSRSIVVKCVFGRVDGWMDGKPFCGMLTAIKNNQFYFKQSTCE
jgi:hypothetical protein